jgi:hypothetical protein
VSADLRIWGQSFGLVPCWSAASSTSWAPHLAPLAGHPSGRSNVWDGAFVLVVVVGASNSASTQQMLRTSAFVSSRQATARGGHDALMTDDLSDDELDRMEGRTEACLAGPWEAFIEGRDHTSGDNFIRTGGLDDEAPDMYVTLSYWNSERPTPASPAVLDFIAAARQDLPR